jgi:hypothetical protein
VDLVGPPLTITQSRSPHRLFSQGGGFDKALSPADFSEGGLLTDQVQALGVQKRLREENRTPIAICGPSG